MLTGGICLLPVLAVDALNQPRTPYTGSLGWPMASIFNRGASLPSRSRPTEHLKTVWLEKI